MNNKDIILPIKPVPIKVLLLLIDHGVVTVN